MFLQEAPAIPGIDGIFTMLKSNVLIGLLAIITGLITYVVIFKLKDIMDFFKERANKKDELELKKLDDSKQQVDRHYEVLDKLSEVVSNNTQAIVIMKETTIAMDGKSAERASLNDAKSAERSADLKSFVGEKLSNMENRIIDKIVK